MNAAPLTLNQLPYLDSIIHRIVGNMLLISQVSLEGEYQYLGNTHQTLLGYEPESLLHQSIFDYIHPEELFMVRSLFKLGLDTGQFKTTRIRFRCRDEQYIHLETQGMAVYNKEQQITGAVFVTRDITEEIRLENELARLEQLKTIGQMTAGLVHEVRNQITSVRGFLQFLGDHEDLQPYGNYFALMIEELDGANQLMADYLSMAKEKEVRFSWQDLNAVIRTLYPFIAVEAARNNHRIILDLGNINEVYMDGNQIRQLIVNLVNNGLEAMQPGFTLTIRTLSQGNHIILAIEDQGAGIDAAIMERIGTPFFTTKEQGTGLGLSICKNIAARHKAKLTIESGTAGSIVSVCFKDFKVLNDHDGLGTQSMFER
ncbi:MAG TPA: ATP-binding protein [Syntrophomonas sp.]|nr:ATP-binding protein [Syntrophomonas sp.]